MRKILLIPTLLSSALIFSQQVIGEFPEIDGGMEAQIADDTMSSQTSSAAGTPSTIWSVSSTSNSAIRSLTDDASLARSGSFFATIQLAVGASNLRLQSPSPTSPTIQTDTEYTIQFFYKSDVDPGGDLDPGIYLNNTSGGVTTNKTDATTWAMDTWTKSYGTITSGSIFNASNWVVARINNSNTTAVSFDDFVLYAGPYDDTAPDSPTSSTLTYTVSNTADLSWTAPSTGVDGGGYVVVKYLSDPAADNDINQNGVYQVGNVTTNGTGSLEGTVVYIGTDTSYSDTYTSGAFYKVYTADKAFNYSEEITLAEDPALSNNDFTINGTKLAAFPVPMTETLNVVGDIEITSSTIYALNGKKVATSNEGALDVTDLSKGAYILEVESNGKKASKMVVK